MNSQYNVKIEKGEILLTVYANILFLIILSKHFISSNFLEWILSPFLPLREAKNSKLFTNVDKT